MNRYDTVDKVFGNFDYALINFYEVRGTLVNKTLLHIGSGGDMSPGASVDNPVARLPDGKPYIPGSSIKGVLRSIVESYLSTISKYGRDTACYKLLSNTMGEKNFLEECPHTTPSGGEKKFPYYCVNHGLFGGPNVASHIQVFDIIPDESPKIIIKPGVAIDRFLGAAKPEALYNIEAIAPGTKWSLRMRIYGIMGKGSSENSKLAWDCAREALAHMFEYIIKVGISFGGRSSAGHGYMMFQDNVEVTHIYIDPSTGKIVEEKMSIQEFIKKLVEGDL